MLASTEMTLCSMPEACRMMWSMLRADGASDGTTCGGRQGV